MNQERIQKISATLNLPLKGVQAALGLLDEGATIPFIARYRKEVTLNLDEEQLRAVQTMYDYETNLFNRKEEVLRLIEEKGKLTPELAQAIQNATQLKEVDDLYLPYREKKKTRATIAQAKGLEPLADWIMEGHEEPIEPVASRFINDQVTSSEEALAGAQDILAERIAETIDYRRFCHDFYWRNGLLQTELKKDAVDERRVYENYYQYSEPIRTLANHRILAIDRGEKADILRVNLVAKDEEVIFYIRRKVIRKNGIPANAVLIAAIEDGYKRLLAPAIIRELRNELKERAETQAIDVFTRNLEQLLYTPPLKNRTLLGVDPAFRTGCKLAVLSPSGDLVDHDVMYPHEKYKGEQIPAWRREEAKKTLFRLLDMYQVELIAIGNGTASRETEEFIASSLKEMGRSLSYVITSEAGASVYSASELAKKEYPQLQVEERSAISIARRVLDPLAELIKIDPKSIGVGQYQHDVNQKQLNEALDFTISKVVNHVGVNLNTATVPLLSYVSGLTKKSAENIVDYRVANGLIQNRTELKKIKGIGPKSFEQAIGFLKILDSENPLDKTFIHPDNYAQVEAFLASLGFGLQAVGSEALREVLKQLNPSEVATQFGFGEYSVQDILAELARPLRDIRDEYPMPLLRSDLLHLEDLKPGTKLQGTVRSIVDFGVFVDIGLKNDGMIHKSKLTTGRIDHPLDVVSIGQIVTVYVLEVSIERQRVSLSLIPYQ